MEIKTEKATFRSSARLISTIGEDIIKDIFAAIVELVKNAYDADATVALVEFSTIEIESKKNIMIRISDNGHGMSKEVIVDKWLVPSTNDKLKRKISPSGRVMQGRKGIGRFAASILGEKLTVISYNDHIKTQIDINWDEFNDNKYLDEIELEIKSSESKKNNGTHFIICGSGNRITQWNNSNFKLLINELRKLITPLHIYKPKRQRSDDKFDVYLRIKDVCVGEYENLDMRIEAFPLLDYFDYKLSGVVDNNGNCDLLFENSNTGYSEKIDQLIKLNEHEDYCGKLDIDLRVFDRDPEAIEKLAYNLHEKDKAQVGKNDTRRMLNEIAGVGIYRNGFSIRPYGEQKYDWLMLDTRRVQNPTSKIGLNQISGYIGIQSEEESNLLEKSARDGLKQNSNYDGLVSIIQELLTIIESRRYSYRKKTGKGRKKRVISSQMNLITDFEDVKRNIVNTLRKYDIPKDKIEEVRSIIEKDTRKKEKIAIEIENTIAIYQGQATLGKIMNIIMHEVRKPLGYIRNQTKNLNKAYDRYIESDSKEDLEKIIRIIEETENQVRLITELFKRLNPLATKNRGRVSLFNISNTIQECVKVFESEIKSKNIEVNFNIEDNILFSGWRDDIYIALTNILENAIYWVSQRENNRQITIDLFKDQKELVLRVVNNGPEVPKHMIESSSLFDPGITAKPKGTGIGLPIAGEAVSRNMGELRVVDIENGACFIIRLPKEGDKIDG